MALNNGPGYFQYTIQPGDSLWDIADEYNVSAEEIMAANPNVDFNNLAVGQAINVAAQPQRSPSTSQPSTRPSTPERRPGTERGREEREFRRPGYERRPDFYRRPYYRPYPYRPYYRPYPYRPYYPPYQPVQACPYGATPYVVEPGDSLYSIAGRFGLSVDAVVAANPYVNFGIPLQVGQNICLPVSG